MVLIVTSVIVIVCMGLILVTLLSHVPKVLLHQESYMVGGFNRREPFYKKTLRLFSSRQKLINRAIIIKAIRGLKVVSLKIDNLSTRLLEKIRLEADSLKD